MKALHRVKYFTTILATKGMIFDYNKLMNSSSLSDDEKRSLKINNNATDITYQTHRSEDMLTDFDYIQLFGDCMIQEPNFTMNTDVEQLTDIIIDDYKKNISVDRIEKI